MEKTQPYLTSLGERIIHFAPQFIGAIVIFIIGLWIINYVTKLIAKAMNREGMDHSLRSFLLSLISVGLKIFLIITAAGILGIQTTSFVAILGAAGLAVGLALQGSLANFAGGVLTLTFKPYVVGDLIETLGQTGVVQEIQIFNTILLTPENKTVILPNGAVSNGTIINYNRHGNLRVDLLIAVAPSNDVEKVRSVIDGVFQANEKVLKVPAPSANVLKMADGMVTFAVRPYTSPENYWAVYFGIQEQIKVAFEKNNIASPMPTSFQIQKNWNE